jgi:lipid A disaccharide synthetase
MPLNKPDIIPFVGVLAVLKWIPFVGKPLVKKAALKYAGKFKFCSLPNIYQNKKIVPEIFGIIKTDDITDLLIEIIENDEVENIKQRLSVFSAEEDPAEKIIRSIWSE